MSKNAVYALVGLLVVAGVAWYVSFGYAPQNVSSPQDEAAVRALVVEFGTKLQQVSLLAPQAEVSAAMQTHYGPYLSAELLALWQADPSSALGRRTSSPWPDRIDVVSVEQIGEGRVYHVEGNVIEVANTEIAAAQKEAVAVQPVTLSVEQLAGRWIIVEVGKGAYSELATSRSVVGFWECLPKVGPGPHTMECAFGIALDASDGHLAVNTSLMSAYPVDFPTGTKVRIEGVVTPANQLSSDQWRSYDIDGIISATTIEKVQ